jgi:hypothetical protein
VALGAILFQMLFQRLQHRLPVFLADHVDEIEDDDAAQIAQPQLPGNGGGGFQIGLEDGFFEIAMTDISAGIDVDGGHRLGLIDDQIAAGFEWDLLAQRPLQFVLNAIQLENRPLAGIVLQRATISGTNLSANSSIRWQVSRESMRTFSTLSPTKSRNTRSISGRSSYRATMPLVSLIRSRIESHNRCRNCMSARSAVESPRLPRRCARCSRRQIRPGRR